MPKKKSKTNAHGTTEDFRIYLDEVIRDFLNDPARTQVDFPNVLTNNMRAYIHEKCLRLGIKSRSHGKEPNRILSLYKKAISSTVEEVDVELAPTTLQLLKNVNGMFTKRNVDYKHTRVHYDSICKIFQGTVMRVPPPGASPFTDFRRQLPIYKNRQLILDAIKQNPVVIVSAETGSGKTTQIPQYIIEEAAELNTKVRVICTQPRRLSTVAVAERVASERGENVGKTIGYQIKLESRLSVNITAVVYCTNGVLLRTLMAGDECFQHVTHIIVDEIHERDKFTDFLLIILRQAVRKFPHLRIILMSATMDMDGFVRYFDNNASVLSIEGRSFACCSWFLEDVLKHIGYENARMKEMRLLRERNGTKAMPVIRRPGAYAILDAECAQEVNEALMRCFDDITTSGCFDELMQLYLNENVDPNFQDWCGRTALMAAAKAGNLKVIEQLLNMGADMFLSSSDGITASGWAQRFNHTDVVNMLTLYQQSAPPSATGDSAILAEYDRTVNDEFVDHDLIVEVIKHIHFHLGKEGAILVFLPGYEDIVACHDRISASSLPVKAYELYMLHGSMEMKAQHMIFQRSHSGRQKIILSTNIAETSITIDDVRFVVDSGKAKVKTYDARTGISTLKSEWISMASSRQRAGRAGRTQNGYCFHLYSINRYESFYVNAIPEILRTPLHELCLQTTILAPATMSIADFLNLAIDPPQAVAVEEAIATLKRLGALDDFERMTDLGHHLVQFSIEPRLAKMLLYGVIFKCLDPVLTIVASMAQKDPFVLPSQPHFKQMALETRKQLAEDALSDHVIFIRVFQRWQEHKVENRGYQFCNSHFISPAVMELIMKTRTQLLSQLRAMKFVQANIRDNIAELNSNSEVWPLVKCCLAAGLYPNVALYNNTSLHTKFGPLTISTQSSLKNSEYDGKGHENVKHAWLLYDEISKPRIKTTVKSATVVTPLTIALICGQNSLISDASLVLDDAYGFNFGDVHVITLRNNIQQIIYQKIVMPSMRFNREQLENLSTLMNVLLAEEAYYDLQAPAGIGKRPRITHLSSKCGPEFENQHRATNETVDADNFSPSRTGTTRKKFHVSNYAGNFNKSMFPQDALYFIIKPWEEKNITISIKQGVWNFSPQTEKKLFKHLNDGHTIFLIFHVRNSFELHGVARLLDTNHGVPNQPCPVEWISSNVVPLYEVKNLIHSKVHLQEDGLQLEARIGQRLSTVIYQTGPHRNSRFTQHTPRNSGFSRARPILGNHSRGGGGSGTPRAGPSKSYY